MRTRIIHVIMMVVAGSALIRAGGPAIAASEIRGVVRDTETGDPLPGANVVLKGTSLGGSADINGKYMIRNVAPGSYTIRVTYVGYNSLEAPLQVADNAEVVRDFKLQPVGVEGEAVVVTAQAVGQNAAINQQLASSQIVNVVSSARIQELPDANAAESVGRLPGVSVTREGGEGNQVVIRGLAPKYNLVMIDGVQMAPTDVGDRGTDLSMISSSMLEGIEVTKAITPDMDAGVLGGTVNFRLREAKETDGIPQVGLLTQGAYNGLEKTHSDFKLVGSVENRFLDNQLGLFAEFNDERKNLTSNELGGSYYLNDETPGVQNPVYLSNLNLNDVLRDRRRYGGTLVLDYRFSDGKISLMNFFSSGDTKTQNRGESYSLTGNEHDYTTTASENKLNVVTNLVEFEKTLPLFTVNAKVSHSYSENRDPNDISFTFIDQTVGLSNPSYPRLDPRLIPGLTLNNLNTTYLQNISASSSFSRDRAISGSLDIITPVRISDDISGSVKLGGKVQYRERSYDYEQGDGVLTYSGGGLRQSILDAFPWMKSPAIPDGTKRLPIGLFADPDFSYGTFLGGDYTMGVPVDVPIMQPVINIARQFGTLEAWAHNSFASITNDYTGFEHQSAAYAMGTANIGAEITLIAGVRYQVLSTSYLAPRGTETSNARYLYQYRDTTIGESHGRWLPMAHLIYRPLTWLQVRLAYTNALSYPDYNAITPRIDVAFNSVAWNNYALQPSHSSNYDAVVSLLDNTLGLLSIDGFYKRIDNLIFPVSRFVTDPAQYPGIPANMAGKQINTTINDPFVVNLWGIEIDWQTHFWYLPGPLSGLVLSANYTHILSKAKYPLTTTYTTYFPVFSKTYIDTYYDDRLIDQPDNILNIAVGYDYSGFSVRLSLFSQADVFKTDDFHPELRANTAKYLRWDLSVKQTLPWFGLQTFFDLNNINSAREIDLNQGSGYPTSEQHYGMTADLGLRLRL